MSSDSEDEIFWGPVTVKNVKLELGYLNKKLIPAKIPQIQQMESIRLKNSIIEISSEENSLAELDEKENICPISSIKESKKQIENKSCKINLLHDQNIDNEPKSEAIFQYKPSEFNKKDEIAELNEHSVSNHMTESIHSDDTKTISNSFLQKVVDCFSEGNENIFDNNDINKNVQLVPNLSQINEIQSTDTEMNEHNTFYYTSSNIDNDSSLNLVIDITNTSIDEVNNVETNQEIVLNDEIGNKINEHIVDFNLEKSTDEENENVDTDTENLIRTKSGIFSINGTDSTPNLVIDITNTSIDSLNSVEMNQEIVLNDEIGNKLNENVIELNLENSTDNIDDGNEILDTNPESLARTESEHFISDKYSDNVELEIQFSETESEINEIENIFYDEDFEDIDTNSSSNYNESVGDRQSGDDIKNSDVFVDKEQIDHEDLNILTTSKGSCNNRQIFDEETVDDKQDFSWKANDIEENCNRYITSTNADIFSENKVKQILQDLNEPINKDTSVSFSDNIVENIETISINASIIKENLKEDLNINIVENSANSECDNVQKDTNVSLSENMEAISLNASIINENNELDLSLGCCEINSSINLDESKRFESSRFSNIKIDSWIERKLLRKSDVVDKQWKEALLLANDKLISEETNIAISETILTNFEPNLNNSQSSMTDDSFSKSSNDGYNSTIFEDSETECNNTLEMIERLLTLEKMEASKCSPMVQSVQNKTEKVHQISSTSQSINSKIPHRTLLKSFNKPVIERNITKNVKPVVKSFGAKVNSPLKITPKSFVTTKQSKLDSKVNSPLKTISKTLVAVRQSKLDSPSKNRCVKKVSPLKPTITKKITPISPLVKNSSPLKKELSIKSSATKYITPTKSTSSDSPITNAVNELTESFGKTSTTNSSITELRSALRRQLSDLYIEPLSSDKRCTPKPKIPVKVEAKKNIFKTPTVTKVLKHSNSTDKSNKTKNIISPLAFYIHKAPKSPLVVNCAPKPRRKFFENSVNKSNENSDVSSITNPLPFCAYKSAPNVKLVEDKTIAVPKSVRKFFPPTQYVIKHESRIKPEESRSSKVQLKSNNDSLNVLDNSVSIFNASTNSNDVSVRVQKLALRTPKK